MYNLSDKEVESLKKFETLKKISNEFGSYLVSCQSFIEILVKEICRKKIQKTPTNIHDGIVNLLDNENSFIESINTKGFKEYNSAYTTFRSSALFINDKANKYKHPPNITPSEQEAQLARSYSFDCLSWYVNTFISESKENIVSSDAQAKKTLLDFIALQNNKEKNVSQSAPLEDIETKERSDPEPEEKRNTTSTEKTQIGERKDKVEVKGKRIVYQVFRGLLLISIAFAAYLLIKTQQKPKDQKNDTEESVDTGVVSHLPPGGTPRDSPKVKDDITDKTKGGDKNPPIGKGGPGVKTDETRNASNENDLQSVISNYILSDVVKSNGGPNKMAIMIINNDNSINLGIGQKVASVFLKNSGYINTTSLLSRQFVTDGLFDRVFNGGGIDKSKYNFGDYTDYICLGKIEVETEQSDVRSDMIKAVINLELMVVRASNGGETDHLTIPVPHNTGIGFSKQQAIEVATENIVKYLKTYKHEN
jgi:hypothetical protein